VAPQLSIVIVNWNGWPDLQRSLASIEASHAADFEVVVIDNGSTDGSVANLRRDFPTVRVHENATNVGIARAVNQGFQLSRGEYILRLDADTELCPESVARLLRFMAEQPDVAVVAPRTYNTDGTIQETARNFPTVWNGLFGRHSLLTRLFPNNRFSWRYLARDHLLSTEPFPVQQVSGACVLLRRSVLDEVGPLDETFFAYWDDTDWCLRLNKLGRKIYCLPEAGIVHHEENRPGKRKSWQRIWMFHWGAYRLYRKHYTFGALDPRSWLALGVLSVRAALLALQNRVGGAVRPPAQAESPGPREVSSHSPSAPG
jgi:GT2 family glycosyltransferase